MDILSKIKRMVLEPKVYAVMVRSSRGQVLHLGVHFSLEEAYSAARARMEMLAPHKSGEAMDIELWNTMPARQAIAQFMDPMKVTDLVAPPAGTPKTPIDHLLSTAPGAVFIEGFGKLPPVLEALLNSSTMSPLKSPNMEQDDAPPVLSDYVQDMKESKNDLMRKLIQEGDVAQVEKLKELLGSYSKRYVLKAIERNQAKKLPPDEKK